MSTKPAPFASSATWIVRPMSNPRETPTPHRVAKTFRKLPGRAGLPHFRLYDLRHTFASHLTDLDANIVDGAHAMGHAKPTTTLLYYRHWFKRSGRTHIEQMEQVRAARRRSRPCAPATIRASRSTWKA